MQRLKHEAFGTKYTKNNAQSTKHIVQSGKCEVQSAKALGAQSKMQSQVVMVQNVRHEALSTNRTPSAKCRVWSAM
jgi:hypothetical protein